MIDNNPYNYLSSRWKLYEFSKMKKTRQAANPDLAAVIASLMNEIENDELRHSELGSKLNIWFKNKK